MVVNLASPGVKVREVDLTTGRIDGVSAQVGGICGPFEKGPINVPVLIETESELLEAFGKPLKTDSQNQYWLSASNYLSYGGVLRVIRADGDTILTANSDELTSLKIESEEDFDTNHVNDTTWSFAARTPGSWANGMKICLVDDFADQIITGIATTAITTTSDALVVTTTGDIGVTTTIITGISTALISLGDLVSNENISAEDPIVAIGSSQITITNPSTNSTPLTGESFTIERRTITVTPTNITVGMAVTESLTASEALADGTVGSFSGYIRGIITGVGNEEVYVRVTDRVENETGLSTKISYKYSASNSGGYAFRTINPIYATDSTGSLIASFTINDNSSVKDWYDNQKLDISNSQIFWKSIAPKPLSSEYARDRSSKNDTLHLVVVDDSGKLTGTASNIIEKYTFLSKALDAKVSPYQATYIKDSISTNSSTIYNGSLTSSVGSDLTPSAFDVSQFAITSGAIGTNAQSTTFNVLGNRTYTLSSGQDYSNSNGMEASLGNILSGYEVFRNPSEFDINFLIMGPSGGDTIFQSQAKANYLISIADERKDCIACISPHKATILNQTNSSNQTDNIIEFYDAITSSSYAVLDSGIKYTLDRFNNEFLYLECNSDVAGLMARTSIDQYSWFSPAGPNRGSINNAIKLAYNPSQTQKDELYTKRINPIISSPGQGIILFGDKTALSYGSAFDRINVRRLFLTIEKAIAKASRSQLFEFNDEITRSNFVNIVEPYLRDIKAKRGISEFLVVCDRSNNTPEVIDSNEMVADIFVKPNRSINFIGLTFVATRTGVSFTEVVGSV
jgi:hypothetical protein